MGNSTKGKASDNNGIWADDIKTCDATTKEMTRQIFNDALKQDDCTPETWAIIRVKVIYKKEMWKRLVTTARFVLCSAVRTVLRKLYTTDSTTDSTKRNLKTREGLDVLTKRWTILQRADCWNKNAARGVSKCWSRQWMSERIGLNKSPVSMEIA